MSTPANPVTLPLSYYSPKHFCWPWSMASPR